MEAFSRNISRRSAMRKAARLSVGVATATCAGITVAQTRKTTDGDMVLIQIVDLSQAHQDVSKRPANTCPNGRGTAHNCHRDAGRALGEFQAAHRSGLPRHLVKTF